MHMGEGVGVVHEAEAAGVVLHAVCEGRETQAVRFNALHNVTLQCRVAYDAIVLTTFTTHTYTSIPSLCPPPSPQTIWSEAGYEEVECQSLLGDLLNKVRACRSSLPLP